jgi:hypothetical protein
MINIEGLKKAEVLKILYNNFRPLGMGFFHAENKDMTTEEASKILESQTDFDYLKGRVMKIDLSSDKEFEEWLYDRDNGKGSAERCINSLRS